MHWTRRALLQALGTGAACSALGPVLGACTGARATGAPPEPAAVGVADDWWRTLDELRDQLRTAVDGLAGRFAEVSAAARVRRTSHAFRDTGEHVLDRTLATTLVLTVRTRDRRFEERTTDLGPAGVERAVRALVERAGGGGSGRVSRPLGIPRALMSSAAAVEPRALAPEDWRERVEELYQRPGGGVASRIVYRAAFVTCDDDEILMLGRGRDLAQRLVRTRAGVLFLAHQAGGGSAGVPRVRIEEETRGGLGGLELADIDPDAAVAAAERVLTRFSPLAPPAGSFDLLLGPDLAARIVHDCLAPVLSAATPGSAARPTDERLGQLVAGAGLALTDDPRQPGGYGSYFFDDRGDDAAPTALIEAGVLRGLLGDRGDGDVEARPGPSNLILTGPAPSGAGGDGPGLGAATAVGLGHLAPEAAELIAAIDRGYLLEGCSMARVDARTGRFLTRAARAYEIRAGALTAVVHADVDLGGDLFELLGAVRALGAGRRSVSVRGPDRASAATSPFVLTRGHIQGRRA